MSEIESHKEMTRSEVADALHEFANQLDQGSEDDLGIGDDETVGERDSRTSDGKVTLVVGNQSATINPPKTLEFDIEVDAKDPLVGSEVKERVTFDLRWEVTETQGDEELEIK